MKKILGLALSLIMVFALVSCGGEEVTNTSPISDSEIDQLFTSPDDFKGRTFEFIGKVLSVEKDSDMIAVQAYYDIENYDKNVIIFSEDTSLKISEDDYISVKGSVKGEFSGENVFGGKVTAPTIEAISIEVVDYQTAVAPTRKELTVDKTVKQLGYSVTIDKVEFADSETRIYVTVTNNGSDLFSLYSFDAKLVQDGKQIEVQDNYDAEYPEIISELKVGASTSGIVCFPAIEQKDFTVSFSAYSENWEEEINDFEFNIKVK